MAYAFNDDKSKVGVVSEIHYHTINGTIGKVQADGTYTVRVSANLSGYIPIAIARIKPSFAYLTINSFSIHYVNGNYIIHVDFFAERGTTDTVNVEFGVVYVNLNTLS